MENKEIWRDIEGYEGLYQVSSEGRVKSLKYGKEKILKGSKNSWGYLLVNLHKEGKQKHYYIHRLVAQAFISNPDNLPEVNHKNEIKTDNRVENLEWCTNQYNINYGTHNKRMAKTLSVPVLQFTKEGEFVCKWDSMIEVERELGFNSGNISNCCRGERKSVYGYKWRYHYKSIWLKKHIPLIKQKKVV